MGSARPTAYEGAIHALRWPGACCLGDGRGTDLPTCSASPAGHPPFFPGGCKWA